MTEGTTHGSHCCKDHGCKYGDESCPVEAGTEPQEFPCEQCQYETEHKFDNFTDSELELVHAALKTLNTDEEDWMDVMSLTRLAGEALKARR
jgi:hypothetical protein